MDGGSFDFYGFLKDYGGHILGLLALVQLWIVSLYRRYFRKAKLEAYPSARIEIGFSQFGPTIGLIGTLRARNDSVFIRRIQIRATRLTDNAQHTFSWLAFRPNVVPNALQQFRVVTSFLVAPATPQPYNVVFGSNSFPDRYSHHVAPLQNEWATSVQVQRPDVAPAERAALLKNPVEADRLFRVFVHAGGGTVVHTDLDHGFFWHAGDYEIAMMVDSDARSANLVKTWRFNFTSADEQQLRLNTVLIIQSLCGIDVNWNFIYKDYQDAGR